MMDIIAYSVYKYVGMYVCVREREREIKLSMHFPFIYLSAYIFTYIPASPAAIV